MHPAQEPFQEWDSIRDGVAIKVRRSEREVTIRVRQRTAGQVSDDPQPAFPGSPRISVGAKATGWIHGRVQPPTVWRRLVASITGQPIQTPEMQIDALIEELLSEMDPGPQRAPTSNLNDRPPPPVYLLRPYVRWEPGLR
jgi:hypothetical protein